MTLNGWIQIAIYCAIIVALVKPLGWYMTRRLQRRADVPVADPAARSRPDFIGSVASTRSGSRTGSPTPSPCCSFMSRAF